MWSLLFVLIAVGTVFAVVSQSKSFSLTGFLKFIREANPVYLVCAALGMLGFIVFEGFAIITLCKSFNFKCRKRDGVLYSAADIYFSAITPSASGGQPACGYFMIKDGIPASFTTMALVANVAAYAMSALGVGIICLISRPSLVFNFSLLSRILIYIGYGIQVVLIAFFTLMLKKKEIISSVAGWVIKIMGKLRLTKKATLLNGKLHRKMEEYGAYSEMLHGKRSMMAKVLLFNVLQRISQMLVTVFTYLATGGKLSGAYDIFCLQTYTSIGVNCIPIPGAMGITDALMLDCFGSIMGADEATNLELLSRSISFYSCVIICGTAVIVKIIMQKSKERKQLGANS